MPTPVTAHFTPWPWTVHRAQRPPERLFIHGARGQSVAMIFETEVGDATSWNNAHVIAAAPALRSALVALLSAKGFDQFEIAAEKAFALLDKLGGPDA
jgi:hypothetical protein